MLPKTIEHFVQGPHNQRPKHPLQIMTTSDLGQETEGHFSRSSGSTKTGYNVRKKSKRETEEEVGGKTILKTGQGLTLPAQLRRLKTGQGGKKLL